MDDRPDEPTLDQSEEPAPVNPEPPTPEPAEAAWPPLTPGRRAERRSRLLRRLYRQWADPVAYEGQHILLARTVPEDPDAGTHLLLLGVDEDAAETAHETWADAQLASDASPLGRLLHPTVALWPAGGTWAVVRSSSGLSIPEPLHHTSPAAALRAAEVRWRLVTRGIAEDLGSIPDHRFGADPDPAAAADGGEAGTEATEAQSPAAEPASTDPAPAGDEAEAD